MKTIEINEELLEQIKTEKGGYTKGTILLLGVDYPAKKGWKDQVLGSTIYIKPPGEELPHTPNVQTNTGPPAATTPNALLEIAVTQGADIDKLEKLMTLQERWQASEAAKAFKRAMADFQAEKPDIKKTEQASFGKGKAAYSYASLSKLQVVDPILSKFGLSYTWKQTQDADTITITCVVSHVDGHVEENTMSAPHDVSGSKNAIQAMGSTVTYLKRYTLEGALGLATDKDDDGNAGNDTRKPELLPGTDKWVNVLEALKGDYTIEDVEGRYYISPENRDKLLDDSI